jgi:hypothetical protein
MDTTILASCSHRVVRREFVVHHLECTPFLLEPPILFSYTHCMDTAQTRAWNAEFEAAAKRSFAINVWLVQSKRDR